MDSIFKEKEAPFSHSCPQRPLLWHLHPLCISNLLYPPHQNPNSSTISPGLSSLLIFIFLVKFDWALILGRFCSLMIHCLWVSRWDSRWLLTTRMADLGSRLLMPITALVFEFFFLIRLFIGFFFFFKLNFVYLFYCFAYMGLWRLGFCVIVVLLSCLISFCSVFMSLIICFTVHLY